MAKNTIHNQVLIFTVRLFSLLCNLISVHVFAAFQMCVWIGSQYLQKNLEKFTKISLRSILQTFFSIFLQIFRSYTHSAAIAFMKTKLHSSEKNRSHSSKQHLVAESIISGV